MAFITADRVLDSSTSTGTGAFVVSGTPAAGYRTFSTVMSVGDACYYSIQGQTTSEWEVGLGTYSSANTLTRTTVYSSSNAGAAVTFSAGTKNVFITMAASKSPQLDPSGNVTALGTPASIALTNATSLPLATGVTGTLSANNGGSLAWQSVQTGNFTAVAGNAYPVNTTSGAVTVTLPASPVAGQIVQVTDYAGTWATNNCTINPNGKNLAGLASNTILNVARGSLALVYIDDTQGWVASSAVFANPLGVTVSYLVVAGGGGGGNFGGGGAGGYRVGNTNLTSGTVYTVTVGSGGAGASSTTRGVNGSNSVFGSITSTGGGGGGAFSNTLQNGLSGGSGGGAGTSATSPFTAGTPGSGTSGQGNSGGLAVTGATAGGGGGGAGAVGGNGSGSVGGNGGVGSASVITGSSVTYAGGGGGGAATTGGTGGAGGGGNGYPSTPTAGTANTGGGGGGGAATIGASGGSGIVILSIPTTYYSGKVTGSPTVTLSGANVILTFTASGSYTA